MTCSARSIHGPPNCEHGSSPHVSAILALGEWRTETKSTPGGGRFWRCEDIRTSEQMLQESFFFTLRGTIRIVTPQGADSARESISSSSSSYGVQVHLHNYLLWRVANEILRCHIGTAKRKSLYNPTCIFRSGGHKLYISNVDETNYNPGIHLDLLKCALGKSSLSPISVELWRRCRTTVRTHERLSNGALSRAASVICSAELLKTISAIENQVSLHGFLRVHAEIDNVLNKGTSALQYILWAIQVWCSHKFPRFVASPADQSTYFPCTFRRVMAHPDLRQWHQSTFYLRIYANI